MSFRNVVTSFACGGFKGGMNSYPANTLFVPTYRRCYQNFSSGARPMIRTERYIDLLLNPLRSTKTKVLNGWKLYSDYLSGEQVEKITIKSKGNQLSTVVEDEKGIKSVSTSEIIDTEDSFSIVTLTQKEIQIATLNCPTEKNHTQIPYQETCHDWVQMGN